MLDALRKRCEFVDAAAERCDLANVRTLWMRAEDAGRDPTLREVRSRCLAGSAPFGGRQSGAHQSRRRLCLHCVTGQQYSMLNLSPRGQGQVYMRR